MKKTEQILARSLRSRGLSIREIERRVGVSKASVSLWVRNVPLTKLQKHALRESGHTSDVIEKRRLARINNAQAKREDAINSASQEIGIISDRELKLIGASLYWGEGRKARGGMAVITNADPAIIQVGILFFTKICSVPKEKLRGHVHIHSHLNSRAAEKYWSGISGIPLSQFYKTYATPSIASKGKRNTLPYGTFDIYVCDTKLYLRIMGWIEGLKKGILV